MSEKWFIANASEASCSLIAIGAPRTMSLEEVEYPADEVARRHGASVRDTTRSSRRAYANREVAARAVPAPWPPRAA